jgi:hypothetical protein
MLLCTGKNITFPKQDRKEVRHMAAGKGCGGCKPKKATKTKKTVKKAK